MNENHDDIEFYILNENIKTSLQILKNLSKSSISLYSLYLLIFSYIGITIIRKGFFDRPHNLWIN